MEKILIIDDEPFIRENVERILGEEGYLVCSAGSGSEAREVVLANDIDLILLDLNLGTENGITVLKSLKEIDPDLLVIIITGYGSVESAVDALKLGAFHYMKKPFKADALRVIVKLALQTQTLKREVRNLKRTDGYLPGRSPMIGSSPAFNEVIKQVREVARITTTVLITGESGTGKELVARAIHNLSDRQEAAFVAINCASLPANLLESELFGHEKGAFTNATSRKPGLFEEADQGTIFLDEIGEMDIAMQVKLLRVLQERVIRRVGGIKDIAIDVRVIAATNRNLQDRIAGGAFREDLFYRLNIFPIHIPPLRERTEDIPRLAAYFLDCFSSAFGRDFREVAPDAAELLQHYPWPGNIRELRNMVERICIMRHGPILLPEHLPAEIRGTLGAAAAPGGCQGAGAPLLPADKGLEEAVIDYEKAIISQALQQTRGNVLQTAAILKIPRGTLRYKMEKYGL
ncbi:sigma-54 dependent transcriptional regulator [Geobacter sp. SVR]|uniref:sigma-54-dependent transcriptional regulator n=1 Tax=Geobacter sp. SVR TaxID=2495594 RepID=UPI00143F019F|nr:sigma-54 dependent transcriptional regulator [Geobacter sp. SVR]BCS54255.1 sigma-54-dependent Fis family transcriptional regulator [Geobacter sp. SVR]GCF85887.1 sigma-54-dependent Fis family transcriptional regulator [Geobacter sp. SVR]